MLATTPSMQSPKEGIPSLDGLRNTLLVVDLGTTFGGAEIYLESLLDPLQKHVHLIVMCSNPEFVRRLHQRGIATIVLPPANGVRKVFQLLRAAFLLPHLIVRHGIGSVQINGYAEIILLPVARFMRCQAIATRHLSFEIEEPDWTKAPGRHAARLLYRHFARFATRVVCVSEEVGKQVRAIIPPHRVTVIPNWASSIPPFRPAPDPADQPLTILFVGRLVKYKGLQVLLAAMRHIAAARPKLPVRLVVIGDGPYRENLELLAAGLPTEFLGFQGNLDDHYRAADILVSPSLGPEGSCLVAIEAMAHSLPCLLSDLPVYREVAANGGAACLYRTGDSLELAARLTELIEDRELRRGYAEAGYQAVRNNHSIERAIREYLKAFGVAAVAPEALQQSTGST